MKLNNMAVEPGKIIKFKHALPPVMISTASYNGYLIEKTGSHGRGTGQVVWAKLTRRNKRRVLVNVYTYTTSAPADGTYVLLEFVQSGKFFYASKNNPQKLRLKEGDWDPYSENPEDISTTSDPRVFLMKRSGSDVVFTHHGFSGAAISVFPNPEKPAENKSEGENGQHLKLVTPKLRCCSDGDCMEVVE
ncbi:uncharacterized protein LOC118407222 [Branchiostoma floridae]|uniref:Uncharacterized protein LOC118407222 n=1 Tax=Branchiostoma floridae TaxID=7739 RepID=A0A9J7KHM1_BRAFL|nr:uncharacterized protein LOC118407222 [Branchiostoma floridae]